MNIDPASTVVFASPPRARRYFEWSAKQAMSIFTKIRANFDVNWMTILVGWEGLGVFSPWPSRWTEFASLLTSSEVATYANERQEFSADSIEEDLIAKLLSCDIQAATRENIKDALKPLSFGIVVIRQLSFVSGGWFYLSKY
jgi:hypothetical protein